jgi:acyl-CoA thioester hydrolase
VNTELLAASPVVIELPVVWGEMDAYRHVNNVVYFRYFETVRVEYCRRINWFEYEQETGVGPILASTQARFRRALTYPDRISVAARVISIDADRFTVEHVVASHGQNAITTEGQGVVVSFNHVEGKKVPLPEEIRRRIVELEASVAPKPD